MPAGIWCACRMPATIQVGKSHRRKIRRQGGRRTRPRTKKHGSRRLVSSRIPESICIACPGSLRSLAKYHQLLATYETPVKNKCKENGQLYWAVVDVLSDDFEGRDFPSFFIVPFLLPFLPRPFVPCQFPFLFLLPLSSSRLS